MPTPTVADFTVGLALNQQDITRSILKQERILRNVWDATMSSAVQANFNRRKMKGLEQAMTAAAEKLRATQEDIAKLGQAIAQRGHDARLKAQMQTLQNELKQRRDLLKEEARNHLRAARDAARAYQDELARRQAAERARSERRAKGAAFLGSGAKAGEGFGKGIIELLQSFAGGDVKGVASIFGRAGGAAKKGLGKWAESGKPGAGAAGGVLQGVGRLGAMLAKLGAALAAIAAIAAAFAVLVKLFLDADKLVKEMNAGLLQANTASADLGVTWGDLEGKLKEIRGAFTKWAFMSEWKILPKEAIKIMDAWGAAGVKVSQFTEGLATAEQRQEKLRKVTETALTYANLLGMEGSEIASKMGEYMDNLGQSLDTVRGSFSGIYRVASESGYATKKFFGMVLQATSGLTMYNVRLEQTATMLDDLTKSLGLKDGFETLQRILGAMKGKSIADRTKDIMIRDPGRVRQRLQRDAEYQAGNFLKELEQQGISSLFAGAAQAAGAKLDLTDPAALVKSLAAMPQGVFTTMLGQLKVRAETKGEKDQVRALQDMYQVLVRGMGAGIMGMAGAESSASPIYKLIAEFDRLERAGKLAGQSLEGIRAEGLAAAEALGFQGEQAQQIAKLYGDYIANLRTLQGIQSKLKTKEDVLAISPEMREMYARTLGGGFRWNETTGKAELVRSRIGLHGKVEEGDQAIGSLSDWLYANEDLLATVTKQQEAEDIIQAKAIAANTNEMTKILGAIKDGILNDIFGGVMDILTWLMSNQGGEATRVVQGALRKAMDGAAAELRKINEERAIVAGQIPLAKGEHRKLLEAQEKALREAAEKQGTVVENVRDRMRYVSEFASAKPEQWEHIIKELGDDLGVVFEDWGNLNNETKEQLLRLVVGQSVGGIEDTQELMAKYGLKLGRLEGTYVPGTKEDHDPAIVANTLDIVDQSKAVRTSIEEQIKQEKELAASASKDLLDKHPDRTVEALARHEVLKAQFDAALAKTGYGGKMNPEQRKDLARELALGGLTPQRLSDLGKNSEMARMLLGMPEVPESLKAIIRKSAGIEDGLIRVGRNRMEVMRIREDDILRAGTPTGPLSKGGGPRTITNNFWEGKSAFASVRDYERAKGQYQ